VIVLAARLGKSDAGSSHENDIDIGPITADNVQQ